MNRLLHERELLPGGIWPIAGVDEAGRGPLAGPVVAAAVVLPRNWVTDGLPVELDGLNDSKQLSADERDEFFIRLCADPAVDFGIAEVGAEIIDRINILQATHQAMNEALGALRVSPQHALVDGTRVKSLRWPQTPLVKGDSRSYSIAAASVLAKVTRDRIMLAAHAQWPEYAFDRHKGYPTPEHLELIRKHGPCPIHRRSFAPFRRPEPELFPG